MHQWKLSLLLPEIEDGGDPGTGRDGTAVLVPFDAHVRVANGGDLSLEMGVGAFVELAQVVQRFDEAGTLLDRLLDGDGALEARVVLEHLDLFQTLRMLRRALDGGARADGHGGRRLGLSGRVAHAARVHAAVLADHTDQQQRDVAETVGDGDARAGRQRHAIDEPLDAHRRIGRRVDLRLKVRALTLRQDRI